MEQPQPWWANDPTIEALRKAALADLERALNEPMPAHFGRPDPVVQDLCSGASTRELRAARDDLARAKTRYDAAVLAGREAGLSWGEIGVLLGVSRQQLHRRYREACAISRASPGYTP